MEPVSESLSILLAPTANYRFQVTLLHEDSVRGAWVLRHLQLTLLSTSVLIQIDAIVSHASFVCLGPEDPYENTPRQADAPQYWLPAYLLGNTAYFQRLMTLSVQVSQCPIWAFLLTTILFGIWSPRFFLNFWIYCDRFEFNLNWSILWMNCAFICIDLACLFYIPCLLTCSVLFILTATMAWKIKWY